MVVELSGEEAPLASGFNYLETHGVKVEPLAQEIRHMEELCNSCTACVPICPTAALDVDRETWQVTYNAEKCVVCLSCVEVCPYRAVEVSID